MKNISTPKEIIERLMSKGVTQKEIAKNIGVTPVYISYLKNGRRSGLSWENWEKLKKLDS